MCVSAEDFGIGVAKLSYPSNNGEIFEKENTYRPRALDIYFQTTKPFSLYTHVLLTENNKAIAIYGFKYGFGIM